MFVGIDMSKDTFDVCLIIDSEYILSKFSNNESGFKKFLLWIHKHIGMNSHFSMEAAGKYGEA